MNFKIVLQFSRSFPARQQWRHEFSFRQFPDNSSDRVTTMKLKKQHFSTSNISAIISPIGLKRQNMFIWFLINTLHYNQMERKNVEILVHLTFKRTFTKQEYTNVSENCLPLMLSAGSEYVLIWFSLQPTELFVIKRKHKKDRIVVWINGTKSSCMPN